MCQTCIDLRVPERLWCGDKEINNNFDNETLLRRFMVFGTVDTWKKESKSAVVFPLKSDSYNKSSLCGEPTDVLYNTNDGNHFVNHGILSIDINAINNINVNAPEIEINNVKRIFTLNPVHTPTLCMYPHCELLVYEGDTEVNIKAPKSIGVIIRDLLLDVIQIVKEPENEVA